MTTNRKIALLIALVIILPSCTHSQKRREESFKAFQKAYRNEDVDGIATYYPGIFKLYGNYYKADELVIDEIKFEKERAVVSAECKWTNPFGKTTTHDMTFYMVPDKNADGKYYKIADSKGFVAYDDNEIIFARKVGAIDPVNDKTDLQMSPKMEVASKMFARKVESMRNKLNTSLYITGFNWEKGYYSNYASGQAMVTNKSLYSIPQIKYRVTYRRSKNGDPIVYDDGTVSYSALGPGQSKTFTWYTGNCGNASWAEVNCSVYDYNDDWLKTIVASDTYSGTEYSLYQSTGYF